MCWSCIDDRLHSIIDPPQYSYGYRLITASALGIWHYSLGIQHRHSDADRERRRRNRH